MDNPSEILIVPFNKVYETFAAHTNSWAVIHQSLQQTAGLPKQLELLKNSYSLEASKIDLSIFEQQSKILSDLTFLMMQFYRESVLYPCLIGSWAILEASFDDLILRILINDKDIVKKLQKAGVKTVSSQTINSKEWAKEIFKRVEAKAKNNINGSVVDYHKNCLSIFEIYLEYQADRASLIEEVNQIRNCILHNNGIIDAKAAKVCPSLNLHIGDKTSVIDRVFIDGVECFANYTVAWIAALMHSPYLNDALLKDAKNPFASQAIVES